MDPEEPLELPDVLLPLLLEELPALELDELPLDELTELDELDEVTEPDELPVLDEADELDEPEVETVALVEGLVPLELELVLPVSVPAPLEEELAMEPAEVEVVVVDVAEEPPADAPLEVELELELLFPEQPVAMIEPSSRGSTDFIVGCLGKKRVRPNVIRAGRPRGPSSRTSANSFPLDFARGERWDGRAIPFRPSVATSPVRLGEGVCQYAVLNPEVWRRSYTLSTRCFTRSSTRRKSKRKETAH